MKEEIELIRLLSSEQRILEKSGLCSWLFILEKSGRAGGGGGGGGKVNV